MDNILEKPLQNELVQSFHDYSKLFAWSYKDMSGLDVSFMVHNLVVEKGVVPAKQKLRNIPFQVSLLVKKKIEKQQKGCKTPGKESYEGLDRWKGQKWVKRCQKYSDY